jgi:hypothetical protein
MSGVNSTVVGLVALLFIASSLLFAIDVFIKRRAVVRQSIALGLSIIGLLVFDCAYGDRANLPGSVSLRELMRLQGTSSILLLWIIVFALTVRVSVYAALFVVPAITLSDAEYLSEAEAEARANDDTATLLAYIPFLLAATALLTEKYSFGVFAALLFFMAGVGIYIGLGFTQNITDILLTAYVEVQILLRTIANGAYIIILQVVVAIGRFEDWRRHGALEDEAIDRLEERIRDARSRNKARQADARTRLTRRAAEKG